MTAFKDRTGDFTKKKHLYKFYKNGYTSRNPKYMTAGQYMAGTGSLIEGSTQGNAYVIVRTGDNSIGIFGNAASDAGLSVVYRVETDQRRKMDIQGLIITFSHGYFDSMFGSVGGYDIQLFDYTIRWSSSGNTIKAFYKNTELASATMAAGYSYIRMRELGGVFYIDRSSDGATWTNWTSRTIDFSIDTLRTTMSLQADLGAGGNGKASVNVTEIEAVDRQNNLLAVEAQVLSDLEFTESINNPASSTTLVLPYSPLNVPAHCDIGNFVEVYTNFYDDGDLKYEPILDHNGDPILDENSQPITGAVLHGNVPEQANIQKFSGYIDSIDYDYDNQTIALLLVSHGETMANSIIRDGDISVPIASQLSYNGGMAPTNERRQTFTVPKMTKLDAITVRVSASVGGASQMTVGSGAQVLGSSNIHTWSGGIGEQDLKYELTEPLYLEPGVVYWFAPDGVNWRVNQSGLYPGGSYQIAYEGVWSSVDADAYFVLYTTQLQLAVNLSGTVPTIAESIFGLSLNLDYAPLYIEQAQETGYDIDLGLNMDSAKNAFEALYRQLPTGWFYHVDVGTGAVRIRNKNSAPDHLLVFGRDFTEMKVTKDINGIINDIYYVGGAIVEEGPKLTVRSTDVESMADYRQGLSIVSNDKVTRYDTAQLIAQNIIDNNKTPRLTTEITLSAAKYNTETVRPGDVVKIVNGDQDVLASTLVVATVKYSPSFVTISLDSAPQNISRTIDAINRQLENMQTANAGDVI